MNIEKMLIDAANEMMKKKDFEEITVSEISMKAGLSRQAFYNHFKDKYDLVNSFYENYIEENIIKDYSGDNYLEVSKKIYEFIYEYRFLFNKAAEIVGQNAFTDHISAFVERTILKNYIRQFGKEAVSEKTLFQLKSVVASQIMCSKQWLKSGCAIPVETVA